MRTFDILAAVLLVVGGLNWGLVGLADFDLVAALFGAMSPASRLVYAVVGLAAVYQAATLPLIQRRWGVSPARA
ncbi:MAG TPA: DUF378 domain-containing protein [Gemmatimonadota bacterium]|nr:DUF378 domain-containing protein [Gemmatimonadota bacterium]